MTVSPDAPSRVDVQRRDRFGSAMVRAIGRAPRAEYRAHHLTVAESPVGVATPYLTGYDDAIVPRGVFDALGARLRYSDLELHRSLEPDDLVGRVVFDVLEQVRCEALVPAELDGARANIEAAFGEWCAAEDLSDTSIGLLLYTVLHMARSRLVHPLQNELVEETIEATRANISPLIGPALRGLVDHVADQAEFAVPALSIAAMVSELTTEAGDRRPRDPDPIRSVLVVPPEWGTDAQIGDDGEMRAGGPGSTPGRFDQRSLDEVGGYHVFTGEFDRELRGDDLYDLDTRKALRATLDDQIAAQSVSVFTLARRLHELIVGLERDGWHVGEEDGSLDASRLAQVVANPSDHHVFRHERFRLTSPAVVSFLIDNSGSMKRQRHETVAVLVDTLARALDLAGASSEILGFTTGSWNGGEPLRMWRRAGEPAGPGRLAELDHIVYKDAGTPWRLSRLSVASLMRTRHFRESVDGEAITWALRRLLARPEPRKFLVVISDGAPMEAATMNANGEAFLEAHLRSVARRVELDPVVELGAIAIDLPVDEFFGRSVPVDLDHTLTLADYRLLERLFGTSAQHRRLGPAT